jgi:hypothetical protein
MRALQMSRLQERTALARGSRDNWLAERHVKRVMAAGLYVIVRCCSASIWRLRGSLTFFPVRSCVVAEKNQNEGIVFSVSCDTVETPL